MVVFSLGISSGQRDSILVALCAAFNPRAIIMDRYLPASFFETLGGAFALFAIVYAGLSLCLGLRAHTLRLFAIFVVASLALLSNNVTTYFAAIFVIATAITELEFLQNLAAIIRGNKEYFDFKKETLSKESKLEHLASEVGQVTATTESNEQNLNSANVDSSFDSRTETDATDGRSVNYKPKIDDDLAGTLDKSAHAEVGVDDTVHVTSGLISRHTKSRYSSSIDISRVYDLESKALDKLEIVYSSAIERGVRLRRGNLEMVIDGYIQEAMPNKAAILFEVKYRKSFAGITGWVLNMIRPLEALSEHHQKLTGKKAQVVLVLIIEEGAYVDSADQKILKRLNADQIHIYYAETLLR
jgi:hypothetical protein